MRDKQREGIPTDDFVKTSRLYRKLRAERDEIDRYKWLESEKCGGDIGYDRALVEWILKDNAHHHECRR